MAKEATNTQGEDADDEVEDTRKGSKARQTIQKPTIPSKANIQRIYETFTNAKNKNTVQQKNLKKLIISYHIFQEFRRAKGKG